MALCEKGIKAALNTLKDTEASFWNKAEAESYLRNEMIHPVMWKAGKAIFWEIRYVHSHMITSEPERAFNEWLNSVLASD